MKLHENYALDDFSIVDEISGTVITRNADGSPLSYVFDEIWDFRYSKKFSSAVEEREISFKSIPVKFRKNIQYSLSLMLGINAKLSEKSIRHKKGHLHRIAICLGTSDWSKLDNDNEFRHFKSQLKKKKFSKSTVQGTLITLNQLFQLKFTSRNIENIKKTTEKIACPRKPEKIQHIAIPEVMASKIFKSAESVIEKYHPFRKEISDAYATYYLERDKFLENNPKVESKKFWKKRGQYLNFDIPIKDLIIRPTEEDLDLIKTACFIQILGYSGIRNGEGISIGRDGYEEKEYHGFKVPYINGVSTKPNEKGLPTEESWITHPSVKKALELLFDSSQFARDAYRVLYSNDPIKLEAIENGLISTNLCKHRNKVLWSHTSLNANLNKFLRANNIVASQKDVEEFDMVNPTRKGTLEVGGFLPKFTSHDFRRTFAVFLTRNKLGSIMTLKKQYKHLNLMMTKWYANNSELAAALDLKVDSELQELVNEANVLIMTETAYEVFTSPTLSGGEGERIEKEREKVQYEGSIYVTKQELERQIRMGKLSIVENPTGYCFNPECTRICSSNLSSVTCKHEAVTREKALESVSKRTRLIVKFKNLLSFGSLYSSIRNRIFVEIKAIEHLFTKHEIEFEPFYENSSEARGGK